MDNNPQPPSQSISEPTPQTILQTPLATNNLTEGHYTPPVTIILLLIFFWPLAIYFMWREKRYHRWFANILILIGTVSLLTLFGISFFVLPKITQIYDEIESSQTPNLFIPQIIALIISLSQLIFGVFLYKKAASPLPTPKHLLIIAIILIIFYNLTIAISVFSAVLPIYSLTTAFETNY